MTNNFEKLIFGGLHEKHAVQRGIWVPNLSQQLVVLLIISRLRPHTEHRFQQL
jgi:hypothetical protein